MSIVQLSMFFVVAVSCDSFYIISKCFMFVNNFFKLFFVAFFISDNLYIISCVFCFVNTFFEVFIFTEKIILNAKGSESLRTHYFFT